jgi:PBP1b-binding outer membrane lipoprotein LpoB
MRIILILSLCILGVACSSAPSKNENYVNKHDNTPEKPHDNYDIDSLADVEDTPIKGDHNEMSADMTDSDNMFVSSFTLADEIVQLRLEIKELKRIITNLNTHNVNPENSMVNMQGKKTKVKPVDLVMRFNSMEEKKRWWGILERAGIKDKFSFHSKGHYKIYLGHFNNHKVALEVKNTIMKATGASTIEMTVAM